MLESLTPNQTIALVAFVGFVCLAAFGLLLVRLSKRDGERQSAERAELLKSTTASVMPERPIRKPKQEDPAAQAIADLKAWRPVGSELIYLGVRMTVIGHSFIVPWGMYGWKAMPLITARYVDRCGTVRTIEIKWLECRRLMEAERGIEQAAQQAKG